MDKEGLSIIFGVKRFYQFLAGRHFTILSDHKPLQHLFQESKGIPTLASARLQRWALTLGAYDYAILYKPGPAHANADVFSRRPLPDTPPQENTPGEITLSINMLQSLPVTAKDVRSWTARGPTLAKVHTMFSSGWKDGTDPSLKPFTQRRDELSLDDGCILWGSRVIVPPQGREKVLQKLHPRPSGNRSYEGPRLLFCLVAWHRQRTRNESETMRTLPEEPTPPCNSADLTMGIPQATVVTPSHRLRWPYQWTHVSGRDRRLL